MTSLSSRKEGTEVRTEVRTSEDRSEDRSEGGGEGGACLLGSVGLLLAGEFLASKLVSLI